MPGDEPGVDVVARQPVERTVAGVAVDAPQPQVGQVGQRPRKSEDDFGGAGGVGGDHLGPDAGLVRDEPVENIQAVTLCAGISFWAKTVYVSAIQEYRVDPRWRPK